LPIFDKIYLESLYRTPNQPVIKFLSRVWEKPIPEDYYNNVYSLRTDHGYEDGSTNPGEEVSGYI
jgi:hypothetical protein